MQQLKTLTLCDSKQDKGYASYSSGVCLQAIQLSFNTTNGKPSQRWGHFLQDVAKGSLGEEWSRGEKVDECQTAAASLSFVRRADLCAYHVFNSWVSLQPYPAFGLQSGSDLTLINNALCN